MIARHFISLAFAALLISSQTTTASLGSDDIKSTVNQFMTQHLESIKASHGKSARAEFQIKSLDPRLTLADCSAPLISELSTQSNSGRVNVKVSCQGQQRWSIYVPVEIKLFKPVITTLIPVARGDLITEADITHREMNISTINGTYFTKTSAVVGMQAKRALKADSVIIGHFIEPPITIKKGDSVLMTAQTNGLVVKIPAVALNNGRIGQQISVRNSQSKRVVKARVSAPGQVTVTM
jgi:flagella basal body P-ring formation protein FlgA